MNYTGVLIILLYCAGCNGQKPFGVSHLELEKTIELPEVKGRIDHLAFNPEKNIIYVAALGNNTVEAIDLDRGSTIHTITGLDEPQGVCFVPGENEIVVANGGNGDCVFYRASDYAIAATVNLGDDADNVRYDPISKTIYVGYGNGAIGVIDEVTHQRKNDIKLPAHPESFQIDQKNGRVFVNVPSAHSIEVIDLHSQKLIDTWKIKELRYNFPMTLDTAGNRVIIGYRHPALMVTYDALTAVEQNRIDLVSDVDDLFFDEQTKEVFGTGGGGSVNIFKSDATGKCQQIANISTRSGARTSLLLPGQRRLIIAERAGEGRPAILAVYKIKD
jgi:hypothetical protein